MAEFQLPPLASSQRFEHLICDLFNKMENDNSYTSSIDFQVFGVKGQEQKGIDIISQRAKTIIQCKVKGLKGKDDSIRKKLFLDINNDLAKVEGLGFMFERLIFASTFRDDAHIQEFLNAIKIERAYSFNVYYWGWDTITTGIEQHDEISKKYFPQFGRSKKPKSALPDGALGTDLMKKNYVSHLAKRYGDWKREELKRRREKFTWAALYSHIAKRYKVPGMNHIPLNQFSDLVSYLQERIDKTIMGKSQRTKGYRSYKSFEEFLKEFE
jgi:hypothetical protein